MIQKIFKVIILLIFSSITIYLCFRNYKLKQEILSYTKKYDELLVNTTTKTDTTILSSSQWDDRLNSLHKPLPTTEVPVKSEMTSNSFVRNNHMSQSPEKDTLTTTNYIAHNGGSQVSFSIDDNKLSIHVPELGNQIDTYKINPGLSNYRFYNGVLTSKQKPFYQRLDPYLEFSIRPLNQFYDLSSGVSFETSRFNYKVGLNLSYYPKFSPMVMKDVELKIIYKF